jgi:hypothetical protein
MKKVRNIALGILLAAAFALAGKIEGDYDRSVDFSSYKTYAWGNNLEPQRIAAKLVITGAIEQELERRGLQQSDVEHADIIIRYQAATDTDMNFNVTVDPTYAAVGGIPLNGATVWDPGFAVASSGRYLKKGTLIIDVFDVQHHKLVWSVTARDTINEHTDKAIKQVSKIVSAMFDRYPLKSRN